MYEGPCPEPEPPPEPPPPPPPAAPIPTPVVDEDEGVNPEGLGAESESAPALTPSGAEPPADSLLTEGGGGNLAGIIDGVYFDPRPDAAPAPVVPTVVEVDVEDVDEETGMTTSGREVYAVDFPTPATGVGAGVAIEDGVGVATEEGAGMRVAEEVGGGGITPAFPIPIPCPVIVKLGTGGRVNPLLTTGTSRERCS